jgi:hypothetical protein
MHFARLDRGPAAAETRERVKLRSREQARDERRLLRSMMHKGAPIILALSAVGALLLGVPASTPAVTPAPVLRNANPTP